MFFFCSLFFSKMASSVRQAPLGYDSGSPPPLPASKSAVSQLPAATLGLHLDYHHLSHDGSRRQRAEWLWNCVHSPPSPVNSSDAEGDSDEEANSQQPSEDGSGSERYPEDSDSDHPSEDQDSGSGSGLNPSGEDSDTTSSGHSLYALPPRRKKKHTRTKKASPPPPRRSTPSSSDSSD